MAIFDMLANTWREPGDWNSRLNEGLRRIAEDDPSEVGRMLIASMLSMFPTQRNVHEDNEGTEAIVLYSGIDAVVLHNVQPDAPPDVETKGKTVSPDDLDDLFAEIDGLIAEGKESDGN